MLDQIKLKSGGACYMREELTTYQHRMVDKAREAFVKTFPENVQGVMSVVSMVACTVERWEGVEGFEDWPALDTWADLERRASLVERLLPPSQVNALALAASKRFYVGEREEGNSEAPSGGGAKPGETQA